MNDEPQIRSRSAAERECDQLRAEVARLREIHHGDPRMLGAVLGYELREAEEVGEVAQLRAERDQALTLMQQVHRTLAAPDDAPDWERVADALRRITTSGLLDDEGQAHG